MTDPIIHPELDAFITPLYRNVRDIIKALRTHDDNGHIGGVTTTEARYLIDIFYNMQGQRVRINNQVKSLERDAAKTDTPAEPHQALTWTLTNAKLLEEQIEKFLAFYTAGHPMAWFFEQTVGIGPILAAGLLAHIDIRQAPTVGHIWNFAGLNPTVTWAKGHKRPWNADLKKICWKIGDSFVKQSSHPRAYYGPLYRARKAYEWERNLDGTMREQAASYLAAKNYGATTDARAWYAGTCDPVLASALLATGTAPTAAACKDSAGQGVPMLPPAQIDMRARRWTVKLFLSHLHQRWYETEFGTPPPKAFALAILHHGHEIPPPQVNPVTLH